MNNMELKINISLNLEDHGQLPWTRKALNLCLAMVEPLSVLREKSGLVFSPTLFEYDNSLEILSRGIHFDEVPLSIPMKDYFVDRSWGALHRYFEILPAFDLSVFVNNLRNNQPLRQGLSVISEEKHGYISASCLHWLKG